MVNYYKANLLDLLSIEHIEKKCFPTEAFDRRLIKNLLMNPKSVVIKATETSGEIIGNIIGIIKKENSTSLGRIFSLCVLDEYRKKGIASQLIQLLEEEFRSRGIKQVRLEVSTFNNTAQSFYKRRGYKMTQHVLANFYNDGSDACVMIKDIPLPLP